jgi:hypothetical protein
LKRPIEREREIEVLRKGRKLKKKRKPKEILKESFKKRFDLKYFLR